jgi:predicted ribosome quality control (RQC) complex YloA/Tae2 family protein
MFDILTVAAVADELNATILDGRIQRVGLLSKLTVGLEIYAGQRRRYLIAGADHDAPRLLLVDREPSFDTQLVTPMLLLLRKYARGGIVVGIEQPPLDRVVRVSIAKRLGPYNAAFEPEVEAPSEEEDEESPDGLEDATFVHLVIEIMGRRSNIILVDDSGNIMEAVKRVTPAMSRVRPIAPKRPYTEPPLDDRLDPRRLTAAGAAALLDTQRPTAALAAVLPRTLRAVSPQMAREIAFGVAGDATVTVAALGPDGPAAVARETRRLLEPTLTGGWVPRVYRDGDGEVIAFSAVPLEHLANAATIEELTSISRAAELGSDLAEAERPGKHHQRRTRLLQSIAAARMKAETRLAALRVEAEKATEVERFRQWGELIYNYLWTIPAGASEFQVEGEPRVPLDPELSAKENARVYFERYRKAQSAGVQLPQLVGDAETELRYLDQISFQVTQAGNFQELEELAIEWEMQGRRHEPKPPAGRRPRSAPPRRTRPVVEMDQAQIYIGRSGVENDRIAFDIAGPNDTWLHARGVPGSHVIVKWRDLGGQEDDETVLFAASLAAYYSANRESGTVEVDVTRRRYVRKIRGAGPGMVTYRNERTVRVRPGAFAPFDETPRG